MPEATPTPTPSPSDDEGGVLDGIIDGAEQIGNFAQDPVGTVAGGALDKFAEAVAESVGKIVVELTTMWTKVPSPLVPSNGKPGMGEETVTTIQGNLLWYAAFVAVLGVIIGGGRMAWEHRAQPGMDVVASLMRFVLVSGCGMAGVVLALQAGDGYSKWVLDAAGGEPGFGKKLIASFAAVSATGPLGTMLLILLGVVIILAALIQLVLMYFRTAVVLVLMGIWPLATSATNTQWGRSWFTKTSGWIIAFLLYKPAAATIYAAGVVMFSNDGLEGALAGTCVLMMSIFALPALMKLCVPLVGGMGDGGGGGAALAAGAAVAVPSGAIAAKSAGGGGSGEAPSGSTMPPGQSSGGPTSGPAGSPGSTGATGPAGPASTGAGAGAGAAAGGAAAAAGPAGAAVAAGAQVAGAAASQGRRIANEAADGGPSGSGQV